LEQIPRAHTIYDVAKLQNSDSLKNVMAKIDEFSAVVRKPNELIGTGTLTQFLPFIVKYNVHPFFRLDIFGQELGYVFLLIRSRCSKLNWTGSGSFVCTYQFADLE
jgi:hypothetical protein